MRQHVFFIDMYRDDETVTWVARILPTFGINTYTPFRNYWRRLPSKLVWPVIIINIWKREDLSSQLKTNLHRMKHMSCKTVYGLQFMASVMWYYWDRFGCPDCLNCPMCACNSKMLCVVVWISSVIGFKVNWRRFCKCISFL